MKSLDANVILRGVMNKWYSSFYTVQVLLLNYDYYIFQILFFGDLQRWDWNELHTSFWAPITFPKFEIYHLFCLFCLSLRLCDMKFDCSSLSQPQ